MLHLYNYIFYVQALAFSLFGLATQRYHKTVPRGNLEIPLHRGSPVAVRSNSDPLVLEPSRLMGSAGHGHSPCTPTGDKTGSGLSHVTSVTKRIGA